MNLEKEDAVRDQNFERAAALRDKERDLQNQIRLKQEEWEKERQTRRPVIGEEEIAFIVSPLDRDSGDPPAGAGDRPACCGWRTSCT